MGKKKAAAPAEVEAFIKRAAPLRTAEQEERYKELRGRRGKEMQLWHAWHEGGRQQEDLKPLLKSVDPLIRSETTKRLTGLGGSIPRSALHNELRNATVRALQSYDPKRGTQLSTHITTNFQRVTDFVAANRNERYMPKEDVESRQPFENAKNELHEELGREPTLAELQARLGWATKKLKKMRRGFGAEVYTDMGVDFQDDTAKLRPHDAFQLARSKMKPQEVAFAELHFPAEGPGMSIRQIARTLGVQPAKAYRIKSRVESLIAPIVKGE